MRKKRANLACQLTVRVTLDLYKFLEEEADEERIEVSTKVREILNDYMEEKLKLENTKRNS